MQPLKKIGPGTTALLISKGEMNDIMKIMKYLEESSLLIKRVGGAIKNEAKKQEDGLLGMLIGTLHGHKVTYLDSFEVK